MGSVLEEFVSAILYLLSRLLSALNSMDPLGSEFKCDFDTRTTTSDFAYKCIPKQNIWKNALLGSLIPIIIVTLAFVVYVKKAPPTTTQVEEEVTRTHQNRVRGLVTRWRDC